MGQHQSSELLADHVLKTVEDDAYAKDKAQQEENMKKLFQELDKDNNGAIDGKEVKGLFDIITEGYEMAAVNVVEGSNTELTKSQVQTLCKSVDANKDQKLQFNEFVALVESLSRILKEGKSMENIQKLVMNINART